MLPNARSRLIDAGGRRSCGEADPGTISAAKEDIFSISFRHLNALLRGILNCISVRYKYGSKLLLMSMRKGKEGEHIGMGYNIGPGG